MLDWAAGRFSRRRLLSAGMLGVGGLTLAELMRLRAAGAATPKSDKSVLLVFVHGGPSHLETYDMKPQASAEIRGPFQPIPTVASGVEVCEHLPEHAKIADKFALIRSCCHDEADHFAGHRRFLSGYGRLKPGTSYESYHPQVGAVINRMLQRRKSGLPPAVAVGGVVVNGPDYAAGVSEGYWSGVYRVPIVNGRLRDATLTVDASRLDERRQLQRSFDRLRRDVDAWESMGVMDEFNRQAVDILTAGNAQEAFDLSQEDPRVRERYGDGYGQEVLLARRLVEAGLAFVTVRIPGSSPLSPAHDWDDHAVNWDMRTAMIGRLPKYDQVITTLISDLYERGLDQKVLVVVTGEFGRTPRLEFKDGRIGRDHWPGAMSILVAGGGVRTGRVLGATDPIGARPSEQPLDPHDLLATMYAHVGIDPNHHISDPFGRPIPLAKGRRIEELY